MAKKDYLENEVVTQLKKKSDLRIIGKQIQELMRDPPEGGTLSKGDVGIGSRGKIDFLVKYCGYAHFHVVKFN